MVYVIVVLTLLVGLMVGAVIALSTSRKQRGSVELLNEEAINAAVQAVLAERRATAEAVASDREKVVKATVDVAHATLGQHLESGSKQLELHNQTFDERARAIDGRLESLQKLVGDLQKDKAVQQQELVGELRAAGERNRQLHETTQRLRDVLASPKSRGQWGERMADDVLRASGLLEGVNYRKQTALPAGTIPDFTFFLPNDLLLNMDVKFPVDNYARFLESDDDLARDRARQQFARDVRTRVKELADRGYIDPESGIDVVLLFVPNESVYAFIHENDDGLIEHALKYKVVLCSPLTLFSVLAVIRQSVDNFRLERRSGEILDYLGEFRSEWTKFSDQLEKVGKHLGTLHNSFDELQGARTNVLNRKLQRIDELEAVADEAVAPAADPTRLEPKMRPAQVLEPSDVDEAEAV